MKHLMNWWLTVALVSILIYCFSGLSLWAPLRGDGGLSDFLRGSGLLIFHIIPVFRAFVLGPDRTLS